MAKKTIAKLEINSMVAEWDDNPRRGLKPCEKCSIPTRTRFRFNEHSGLRVLCSDCGIAMAMKPVQVVGKLLRGLL
jgi:hypothetical protein